MQRRHTNTEYFYNPPPDENWTRLACAPAEGSLAEYFWKALDGCGNPNVYFFYPLPPEGMSLLRQCIEEKGDIDFVANWSSVTAGVFADWLEENATYLLAGATGPTDPTARLYQLIDYLRSRLVGV